MHFFDTEDVVGDLFGAEYSAAENFRFLGHGSHAIMD
jgi:hypothetical protein